MPWVKIKKNILLVGEWLLTFFGGVSSHSSAADAPDPQTIPADPWRDRLKLSRVHSAQQTRAGVCSLVPQLLKNCGES